MPGAIAIGYSLAVAAGCSLEQLSGKLAAVLDGGCNLDRLGLPTIFTGNGGLGNGSYHWDALGLNGE